jgi:hypothetical protein
MSPEFPTEIAAQQHAERQTLAGVVAAVLGEWPAAGRDLQAGHKPALRFLVAKTEAASKVPVRQHLARQLLLEALGLDAR